MELDPSLIRYISRGRGAGVPDEYLAQQLRAAGWTDSVIKTGLADAGSAIKVIATTPEQIIHEENMKKNQFEVGVEHHWVLRLVLLATAILVILFAGTWVYHWKLDRHSPGKAMQSLNQALATVDSFHYQATITLAEGTSNPLSASTSPIVIPTASTTSDSQPGQFVLEGGINLGQTGVAGAMGDALFSFGAGSPDASLAFAWVLTKTTAYLNFHNGSPSWLGRALLPTNTWLTLAPSLLVGGSASESASTTIDVANLINLAAEKELLVLKGYVGSEPIGGVQTDHYRYTIDGSALATIMQDLAVSADVPLSPDHMMVINDIAASQFPEGDIWLGTKDSLPYKIVYQGDATNPAPVTFTVLLSKYNEPVVIAAPASSTPLVDILLTPTKDKKK